MDAYDPTTPERYVSSVFKEKQKFTQWWLWTLLGIVNAYGFFIIIYKFLNGQHVDEVLYIYTGFCLLLSLFFFLLQLHTKMDHKEIYIRYFPFVKKHVQWSEIASAKVIRYGFVGGWGIRIGTRYGTVYNTSGEEGLAVVLKNGKRFVVGTQRAEEMRLFIDDLFK